MSNYFNTTKRRDYARWVVCTISFILISWNYYSINENYDRLYEIEQEKNELSLINIDEINLISPLKEIRPSENLQLQRDITFSIIEICANLCFLVLVYAGRIKVEDLK